MSAPLPASLPLPASPELLAWLHLAAAFVFVVLSSAALGWPVMTLVAESLGAGRGDTSLRRVAVWMARRTPGILTMSLVFAGPVFLLAVVRYGEGVLPAAQQMGWLWLGIGPLLAIGLGFSFWVALRRRGTEPSTLRPFLPDIVESYILAFRRRGLERPGLILTAITCLALLAVGFVFCAHAVLVVNPALWGPGAPEPTGTLLPLRDPQLLPRALHILLGALAVAGFTVAWHGAGRVSTGDVPYGATALKYGILWLMIPIGLQVFTGPWFLYALPPAVTAEFTGGSRVYTSVFWAGISAEAVTFVLAMIALTARAPRSPLMVAAVTLLVSLGSTVAVHQHVRDLAVGPSVELVSSAVMRQSEAMIVFGGVAVAGLIIIAYMFSATYRAEKSVL